MAQKINIVGTLHDNSTEHIVANADEVYDSQLSKKQNEINANVGELNTSVKNLNLKKINKPTNTDTDLCITDKDNNIAFKVDKDGLKTKKYNIVSENGEVVYQLDEDFFTSMTNLINTLNNKFDDTIKTNSTDTDLSITDKDNNIAFKVDKDGLKTTTINLADKNGNVVAKIKRQINNGYIISDLHNNIVFQIDSDGLKARKYSIVNNTGDVVNVLDESFFKKQSTEQKGLGESCKMQEDKGIYCMPKIVETTDYIKAIYDTNNAKFGNKCIMVYSENVPIVDDDNWTKRGTLTLSFDNPIQVKETISVWMYVPSCYFTTSRNGSKSVRSLATIDLNIEGATYSITEWSYIPGGWFLYKLQTDNFKDKILSSCKLNFGLFNKNPEFKAYIGYFVVDQRMIPSFNFNMDADLLGNTYKNGFVSYIKNNNIPIDARLPGGRTDMEGYEEGLKLYMAGNIDGFTYTVGVNEATSVANGVNKLLNNGSGKNDLQDSPNCVRPVIAAGCNTNYADDFVVTCLKEAGFKIARAQGGAGVLTSYFDTQSMIVPCKSYGAIPNVSTYPTYADWIKAGKTDADLQNKINSDIERGKLFIDNCIKYGCFGNIFTHDLCTVEQYKAGQNTTVSAFYEVVIGILNYAIEKRDKGELQLLTLGNFYKKCTN